MSGWARRVAWLAAVSLFVATWISHLEQTAQLPVLFTRRAIPYWTTSRTLLGLPLEFPMGLWFLAAASRRGTSELKCIDFLRMWSGIVVLGLCVGLAYLVGGRCAPIAIASVAALLVLIDSGIRLHRGPDSVTPDFRAAIRHDWTVLRRPQRLVPLTATVAVVLLTGQYLALTGRATTAADRDAQLARWYESEPRLTAAELVAPGRIRVVVFSDYLCPACSLQIPGIERTVNRYHIGGDENVELVLRDFPLNADCNPSVMTRTHPLACRAAVAARVADRVLDPAKSQAFRDRLYARHGRLAEADLVRDLEAVHLLEEFNETYDKELNAVRDDARLGGALGIASTPTVFVDGRLLRDTQPRVLSAILSHLGRNAGAGTVERRK